MEQDFATSTTVPLIRLGCPEGIGLGPPLGTTRTTSSQVGRKGEGLSSNRPELVALFDNAWNFGP